MNLLIRSLLSVLVLIGCFTIHGLPAAQAQVSQNGYYPPSGQVIYAQGEKPADIVNRLISLNQLSPQLVQSVGMERNATLNAYTNGQSIVITDGLWTALTTPDERAFVLSHELSHIVLRHIEKTQVRRVGFSLLDNVLNRFSGQNRLIGVASSIGMSLVDKKFSRNVEYQADELGIQLMQRAGYNPKAALSVFSTLSRADRSGSPEFLRSHPISQSRVQALVRKYQLN
jgi:predicted Zn-dependent protease